MIISGFPIPLRMQRFSSRFLDPKGYSTQLQRPAEASRCCRANGPPRPFAAARIAVWRES